MLSLLDRQWQQFEGGYRQLYDASVPLRILEKAPTQEEFDSVINELWDELHHQGDVGLASYYSVPHLVRIASATQLSIVNIINLIVTIELARLNNNPAIPFELITDYNDAIFQLGELGKSLFKYEWDLQIATSSLSAIAIAKGQVALARALAILDDQGTLDELLETY
ncbi:hypothetical protein HDF24_22890 [Mucilaginibacter sp. X4EP1]|uniref:hypothetical protein n=1 Tax=Mucilaginibacter sp. X4EP1 TaxID=2723092 RepID=UPI002168A4F1|nr:hypothetical protein [Mucilaginibacter sp. X4EP1]MCS3815981.1 hypothetical protein [Mucilaginibacter sp. X4EP1]